MAEGRGFFPRPHSRRFVHVRFEKEVARPLRGSVSCGSGWSVPCVSIQLTLSQRRKIADSTKSQIQGPPGPSWQFLAAPGSSPVIT